MSAAPAFTYQIHLDDCPRSLEPQSDAWALLRHMVATCPGLPDAVAWVARQWSVSRVLMLRERLGRHAADARGLIALVENLKRGIADSDSELCWTTLHSDFSYYADQEGSDLRRYVAQACAGEILTWGFGVPSGTARAIEGAALAAGACPDSSVSSHLSMEAIGLSTLVSESQGRRPSDVLNGPVGRA